MRQEKNIIQENVLTLNSIEGSKGWTLAQKDNAFACYECGGYLFYVRRQWGVVEESSVLAKNVNKAGYTLGNKYLALREACLDLYCAKCSYFEDRHYKWLYPDDKIVCSWDDDELNYAERGEIEYALNIYNHTGQVKGSYESGEVKYLREKITEYEKKNNIESVMEFAKKGRRHRRKNAKEKARKNKIKKH